MRVAVDSLELFSRLADEGASHAAASLSELTGIEMVVDVTDVALLTERDLRAVFDGGDYVGVSIGFGGGLTGETVLVFERGTVRTLLSTLLPSHDVGGDDLDAMARSGVEEVGNIAISGFIDGWANHLDTGIDITPPSFVVAEGAAVLPDRAFDGDDGVLLFQSELRARGADLEFGLYMLPESDAVAELLTQRPGASGQTLPMTGLKTFNEMTRQGAAGAADRLTSMTGVETGVEVSQLRFLPVEDVTAHVGEEVIAGTAFELSGALDGYLAVLFGEDSAETVADEMIPTETADGIGDMEASALKEVGNVMTSGFIDGWADVLGSSIEHSPPEFVHDMGTAAMEPVVGRLALDQDNAFVIDSTVTTADSAVACDIYALPDERDLTTVLRELGGTARAERPS